MAVKSSKISSKPAGDLHEWPRHKREDFTGINLLAAQVAAAASRVIEGEVLDDADRRAIGRVADLYRSQAEVIRYVERGGTGQAPLKLASIGLNADVLLANPPTSEDPERTAKSFDRVVTVLNEFAANPSQDRAATIYGQFRELARVARALAGSPGHRPSKVSLTVT